MKICLYCNNDMEVYLYNNIILCYNHQAFICNSCLCINNSMLKFREGCSKLCQLKLSIYGKRKYNYKCNLCQKRALLHHCNIPMKNKYMNVNIN